MLLRLAALCFVLLTAAAAGAADKPPNGITGVFLTTRYPALTVRAGETTTIDLSLRNFNHPPEQLALSVPRRRCGIRAYGDERATCNAFGRFPPNALQSPGK